MPRSNLNYHFVWATKWRLPMITPVVRELLYGSIVRKAVDLKGFVHAINGMEEHVHLVARLPPTLAPASFIGQVKGYSSHTVGHCFPRAGDAFKWQEEYSVDSISQSALRDVIRYVESQQRIHALRLLRPHLEDW